MKSAILVLALLFALLGGCVMKDDIVVMDDRLYRIEQGHKDLQRRVDRLETELKADQAAGQAETRKEVQALRSQLAEFRVAHTGLRDEIRVLTGQIEEVDHGVREKKKSTITASERLDTQIGRIGDTTAANEKRIGRIEEYLSLETGKGAAVVPGPESPAPLTENELYATAKAAFDAAKFDTAREGFSRLLKEFPKSAHADNAQFWIGEIYYREKWYEKAIVEYQKVIETYPKGNKVPAALLKQGLAFLHLGDKANARLVLKTLTDKHANTNEAKIGKEKLKGLK